MRINGLVFKKGREVRIYKGFSKEEASRFTAIEIYNNK